MTIGVLREPWDKALGRYARAEAELEGVAHLEDDALFDRALGRHNAVLARLLRAAAPGPGRGGGQARAHPFGTRCSS
jgi:hypothetical protein